MPFKKKAAKKVVKVVEEVVEVPVEAVPISHVPPVNADGFNV